jgi:hypothetical protein
MLVEGWVQDDGANIAPYWATYSAKSWFEGNISYSLLGFHSDKLFEFIIISGVTGRWLQFYGYVHFAGISDGILSESATAAAKRKRLLLC